MTRHAATALLLAATLAPVSGCWTTHADVPVIEADDVRMEPPGDRGFRSAGERGDVHALTLAVSGDVNGWVTEIAVGMSRLVRELSRHPETRTDGDWRVYGPHDDDGGKDGAWMVRLRGDESTADFEVYVGRRGAREDAMELLVAGELSVSDDQRDGALTIDFDTLHAFADLLDEADPEARYGGRIEVTFERDLDTKHKQVDLAFDGFFYEDAIDDLDFDGETYAYRRDDRGAGRFHFATWSSFEAHGWSGPALERMAVDMAWDERNAGRARGTIVEVDGEGDLRHGDIAVHECFDADGGLTWRDISEAYADYDPRYAFGQESSCVLEESALAPRE